MQFCGKPVVDFDEAKSIKDPKADAIRISLSYDEYEDEGLYWEDKLDRVLADAKVSELETIVVGPWEDVGSQDTEFIVELLVNNKDKLSGLRQLFIGDVIMEESECSWLDHGDCSPLFEAFPLLTHFAIRGCGALSLGENLSHRNLRSLVIQCSGLTQSVIREIVEAELPELEHLELWLGEENYGADYQLCDLQPLVNGSRFPKLIYLGLKNCEKQDEIANLVATAPILERIKILDLSMGTLTDEGGQALLNAPHLKRLDYLDLHHHYLSDDMMKKFRSLSIDVNVDEQETAEQDDGEIWRFIAVSE
jgi:hypothetical protein